MCKIHHKIMVLSGKGGVGKSTVAVNLATALALAGKRVGLLDVDLHGPSVPKLLGLHGATITGNERSIDPVAVGFEPGLLKVMSIGFLLQSRDEAVIWRGPMKFSAIRQFLRDVEWGELDYLVVDAPPGTGDEPMTVAQLLEHADGAVIVTTPQEIAVQDVRRCIAFCQQVELPVLGVLENMSGLACPHCGGGVGLFGLGGGKKMAEEMEVPFLGIIPIEPAVMLSGENGTPIVQAQPHSEAAKAFGRIVRKLLETELASQSSSHISAATTTVLRIAIPVTQGVLSSHFGHCEQFILFDVAGDRKTIVQQKTLTPPPHEPGTFPKWLHEQGATVIIAGGMGSRAQSLFAQQHIEVVVGAMGGVPAELVRQFLDGCLETGANSCDH